METSSFVVGDRVQARNSTFVPEGTPGSVHQVWRAIQGVCYVQFDGYDHPFLMHVGELARLDEAPPPALERTVALG